MTMPLALIMKNREPAPVWPMLPWDIVLVTTWYNSELWPAYLYNQMKAIQINKAWTIRIKANVTWGRSWGWEVVARIFTHVPSLPSEWTSSVATQSFTYPPANYTFWTDIAVNPWDVICLYTHNAVANQLNDYIYSNELSISWDHYEAWWGTVLNP